MSAAHQYQQALAERGPAIRERLAGWVDDGEHVFVATSRLADGSTDVIVWRTFEGLVGCMARYEFFKADDAPPMEAHYVCIWEENN